METGDLSSPYGPEYEVIVSRRIGVCEECGWWLPLPDSVYDEEHTAGLCPKEGCDAQLMILYRAPKEPVKREAKVFADVPTDSLGSLLGVKRDAAESDAEYRSRLMRTMAMYTPYAGGDGGNLSMFEQNVRAAAAQMSSQWDDTWKGIIGATA